MSIFWLLASASFGGIIGILAIALARMAALDCPSPDPRVKAHETDPDRPQGISISNG